MFDSTNLVCRLFVAYVLQWTHDEYTPDGCLYISHRFYDHVEKFAEYEDAYQRAARRTPLGFAAFFINAERQYQVALDKPGSKLGELLLMAEMKAAKTPVNHPLHVRRDAKSGLWKMYRKLGRGKYELVPQYERMIGFSSKSRAEACARELENISPVA